jgi:hypothetical protein
MLCYPGLDQEIKSFMENQRDLIHAHLKEVFKPKPKLCIICNKKVLHKGLCMSHYWKERRQKLKQRKQNKC